MRRRFLTVLAILALSALTATSTRRQPFTPKDKAFYADEKTVNFVRPGINLAVQGANIAADGTITARVKITDPLGVPLEREGINTAGPVNLSFVATVLPKDAKHYTSYTTRVQTSPITRRSATQAAADTGGVWTRTGDGEYTYRFGTRAPGGFDATATHSIGVYGSRNLTTFDLGTNYVSRVFHFVPAGGTPEPREIIKNSTCNSCHVEIAAHGGSRRGLDMCILCHQPQTTDPDTGNTVDMTVMTHKIHMGKDLPSVKAGTRYQIIGNQQSMNDYSDIGYPANPRNCASCHIEQGPNAGAQAANAFIPSVAACGSCHDNIDFAAGKGHIVSDDSRCAQCHRPEGTREWDISVKGAHTIPERSKNLTGYTLTLTDVRNTRPGERPTVTFQVKDSEGKVVPPDQMNSLSLILGGPTFDYKNYWSEAARLAPQNRDGSATYTFNRAIPADATGTYSISAEGYRNKEFEGPGRVPTTVRDPMINAITYFNVQGGAVERHPVAVTLAKCNVCHSSLEIHGRNRNQIEHCVVCHNPTMTDAGRRTAAQMPAESVNFSTMVHRIHTGKEQGRPYLIYGFGGNPVDFSKAGFPTSTADCAMCHVNNSQNIVTRRNALPVTDPRGFLDPVGPNGAACLGCHASQAAAAHVDLNTSRLGESCLVCHGPNADYSVARVHAR
jgi:OmcA/MtrC family decaheme c-type cytochrome